MSQSNALILLGSSSFKKKPSLSESESFLRSKQGILTYFHEESSGLGVEDQYCLDLFDSDLSANEQVIKIGRFANTLRESRDVTDLFLYYVGHGFFFGYENDYYLATSNTEEAFENCTSIHVRQLAAVLRPYANRKRLYVILDCCFAGHARTVFMGDRATAFAAKTASAFEGTKGHDTAELPLRGSALFCAADSDQVALSPEGLGKTMFSHSLLEVLQKEHSQLGKLLSLSELAELVWDDMKIRHEQPVRPVICSPHQPDGDIANRVRIFPNKTNKTNATSRPLPSYSPEQYNDVVVKWDPGSNKKSSPSLPAPPPPPVSTLEINADQKPVLENDPKQTLSMNSRIFAFIRMIFMPKFVSWPLILIALLLQRVVWIGHTYRWSDDDSFRWLICFMAFWAPSFIFWIRENSFFECWKKSTIVFTLTSLTAIPTMVRELYIALLILPLMSAAIALIGAITNHILFRWIFRGAKPEVDCEKEVSV